MKIHHPLTTVLAALTVSMAAADVSAQVANLYIGPTGAETGLIANDCSWQNMWGGAFVSIAWDPTTVDTLAGSDAQGNSQGSIYMTANYTGDTNGLDDYNMVGAGNWFRGIVFDASQYSSIEMDFKYDTNSTITPASAPHLDIGFDGNEGYSPMPVTTEYITNGVGIADGNWHHLHIPYSVASNPSLWPGIATSGGVSWYQWNFPGTSGTMNYWMANIYLVANATPTSPPTLSISKPAPGLHFVEGSISTGYDRQNIVTANGANSSANYFWNAATSSHPVTYSFNISQFTAPDLNFHIYFYDTTGVGGGTAPDYSQPDVLIFQVSLASNGTAAVASLLWKTNAPSVNPGTVALQITNSTLVGAWQLQFTNAKGGTLIAPGPVAYPFSIDSGLETNLQKNAPITVNFGINPSSDAAAIVGEEVVVSTISITGADPLSVDAATTDNFLADSSLDPNSWTVDAENPASIWLVATNDVYSVDWTVPDSGFSLAVTTNIAMLGSGQDLNLPAVVLTPGKRTLIPGSSLPQGPDAFFYLANNTFAPPLPTQLLIVLPGQTLAPNTPTGVTGTPTPVSLANNYGEITFTVYAVDSNFNPVPGSTDNIVITSATDGNLITDFSDPLVNGTASITVYFFNETNPADTVTATDETNPGILPYTSSPVVVTD